MHDSSAMILESGALVTVTQLVLSVLVLTGNPAQDILFSTAAQIYVRALFSPCQFIYCNDRWAMTGYCADDHSSPRWDGNSHRYHYVQHEQHEVCRTGEGSWGTKWCGLVWWSICFPYCFLGKRSQARKGGSLVVNCRLSTVPRL